MTTDNDNIQFIKRIREIINRVLEARGINVRVKTILLERVEK